MIKSSNLYAILNPEKFGFRPVVIRKGQVKAVSHPITKLLVMKDCILEYVRTGKLFVFLYAKDGKVFTAPYEYKIL